MKREIVTLCGSTRFMKEFKEVERALTLDGKIPLPPAIYGKAEGIEYTEKLAEQLFSLHLDKINISDSIFVIDVEGKLGNSTKKEIEFAEKNKKKIRFYSKEENWIIKKNQELNNLVKIK